MASIAGGLGRETPPPPQHHHLIYSPIPDNNVLRVGKRQRESESASPSARPPDSPNLLPSPSKTARLSLTTASRSTLPLTGAAALEDERRRRVENRQTIPLSVSLNPSHTALESLMTGRSQAMSRPQDVSQVAPTANMEPAAKAASALSMAAGSAKHSPNRDDVSPPPSPSAARHASVTESPTAMEIDSTSTKPDQTQDQQVTSQDEKSQPVSLSYPGSFQVAPSLPEAPARGMSFPIPGQPHSSPVPSGKKHKCPYCSTEFTRHHNLKSHLLTHSQEKPYVCTNCQMRFRRLHDLKRHGKLHTGEKPHICHRCDRKFARGDALARHSKGAGGCAGRRASMVSFPDGDELDGTTGDGEESSMSGIAYDNPDEEDLRRQSLPSIGARHPTGDNYGAHSRTYPPAGPRSATGGHYPTNDNANQVGTAGSSSAPDSMTSSNTANTSISSVPAGTGNAGMYSQAGMTESPKPLSPALPAHDAANIARPRSPVVSQQYQQQSTGRGTSELQSPHGGQNRPKLPGLAHPSFAPPNSSSYSHARTPSGAQTTGDSGNMFAQSDPSVWEYIRLLEDKIKSLSDRVYSLDHEVAGLKKQLDSSAGKSTA